MSAGACTAAGPDPRRLWRGFVSRPWTESVFFPGSPRPVELGIERLGLARLSRSAVKCVVPGGQLAPVALAPLVRGDGRCVAAGRPALGRRHCPYLPLTDHQQAPGCWASARTTMYAARLARDEIRGSPPSDPRRRPSPAPIRTPVAVAPISPAIERMLRPRRRRQGLGRPGRRRGRRDQAPPVDG